MIFKFSITGKEEQVVEFEKELLDILMRLVGDDEMLAHEVHFCVHEAILNILQHTYKWNLDHPLDIRLDISEPEGGDRVLEISIRDVGPAIEAPVIPPEKVDKFQLRKRGLYMISKIMDEFALEALGKTGNVTYMKKVLKTRLDNAPVVR